MPLQPTDVPSRAGIQAAIDEAVENHASPTDPNGDHYDTGWVPVPPNSTYEGYPGREPAVRRVGKMVTFAGSFRLNGGGAIPASSTNTLAFAELPSEFAPGRFMGMVPMAGNAADTGNQRGWIDSGGGIRGTNKSTTTPYMSFSGSWFVA